MRRLLVATATVALWPVVGCGGGTTTPAVSSVNLAECTGEPRPELELGDGFRVCADSGLHPVADEFSFANWGGPTPGDAFSPSLLVTMFGESNVCMDTTDGCVLYPAAQQWMDQMNSAIQGGRCEGMAVLSQRLLTGRTLVTDLAATGSTSPSTVADLSNSDQRVLDSISRWWATQTFDAVASRTARNRTLSPTAVAEALVPALVAGDGPTIGIYANGQGHSVTPVAVSTDGANTLVISVYDNNFPGLMLPITIDRLSDTWSYDTAAGNSNSPTEVWSGATGTIDWTDMADREQQQDPPWGPAGDTRGATVITISTAGRSTAGLSLTVGGATIDTRDLSQSIAGVRVDPFRGASTGARVTIEPKLGTVVATPIAGTPIAGTGEPVPLTMTIDSPGKGSLQFRAAIDADTAEVPTFTFDNDEQFSLSVKGKGSFELDYAYGEESVAFDLTAGGQVEVSEDDDSSTVSLYDDEGNTVWDSGFDGVDDDGEYGSVEVTFDDDSNALSEAESLFDAYDVSDATVDESTDPDTTAVDDSDSVDDGGTDDSGFDDTDDTGTDDTEPDDTGSDDTEPVDSEPVDPGTDDTTPVDTEPIDTEPVDDANGE